MKPALTVFAALLLGLSSCSDFKTETGKVYCQGTLCADDQGCLAPACDPATGECTYEADDRRCYAGESCDASSGECIPSGCSEPAHCADGIPCTEDECKPTGLCVNWPNHSLCQDDGVACTDAVCTNHQAECMHRPNNELCPPGQVCDRLEGCKEIVCQGDDQCDDHNLCTIGRCVDARCLFVDTECLDVTDQCHTGLCLPETGDCVPQPKPEETACDDKDLCTDGDACQNGICLGEAVGCAQDNNPCTVFVCDSTTGDCLTQFDNLAACDDGDDCTVDDRCEAGSCTGTLFLLDNDLDGFFDRACGGNDCDDFDAKINPDAMEICDGRDNDCDGQIDTLSGSTTNQTLCGCLQACGVEGTTCGGLLETCLEIPELISACVQPCTYSQECPPASDGREMLCFSVQLPSNSVSVCLCKIDQCPMPCSSPLECLPFGLTECEQGACTRPCTLSDDCPEPLECLAGKCGCPGPLSCLSCQGDDNCFPPTICNFRPDSTGEIRECDYPCSTHTDCLILSGERLYCHLDPSMGFGGRCACTPDPCLNCQEIWTPENDVCRPYWMSCQTFSDSHATMNTCTTGCQEDHHCPPGWFCWNNPMQIEGQCLEMGCNCVPDLQRECVANGDCFDFHPAFMCLPSPDGSKHYCSMPCGSHGDCPLGYFCGNDPFDPDMSICRCDATADQLP